MDQKWKNFQQKKDIKNEQINKTLRLLLEIRDTKDRKVCKDPWKEMEVYDIICQEMLPLWNIIKQIPEKISKAYLSLSFPYSYELPCMFFHGRRDFL